MSTREPAWFTIQVSSAGDRRVFSAFRTAPAQGTPKWDSSATWLFGTSVETLSPALTPARLSAPAKRMQRWCSSW